MGINIKNFNYPADLLPKVIARIEIERKIRQLKRRIAVLACLLGLAVMSGLPLIFSLQRQIVTSGFWQFIKLGLLDFRISFSYWQEYAMAILETLPVINLIYVLMVLIIIMSIVRLLVSGLTKLYALSNKSLTIN